MSHGHLLSCARKTFLPVRSAPFRSRRRFVCKRARIAWKGDTKRWIGSRETLRFAWEGGIVVIVVTNNPLLRDEEHVLFVEGTFRDVLVTVRDMVYRGYELVSHPLFASSRMMFSPYRSVILGNKRASSPQIECQIAEDSIISYDKLTARRNYQPEHNGDYAEMDKRLYLSALDEVSLLTSSKAI